VKEKNSDKAEIIKERNINGKLEIIAPQLLYFEVLNALKYSKIFDSSELNLLAQSLESYRFKIIIIQGKVRKKMINIAVNFELTIYNASYIALAIELSCLLCTADSKIIKKLPKK